MDKITEQIKVCEAAMLKKAIQILLNSGGLLSADDICQLAGFTTDTQLVQWEKDQKIFSIYLDNIEYYPVYAFDTCRGYQPLEAINEIIKVFGEKYRGLMLTLWFNSANGYLGGKCPKDMIIENPDLVIYAAKIQVKGIQHG
ncbi:hypothetical protein [Acinetobacter ursingii]|uniref:hypothetical protein n=1 Tax=Acinetobacter ursingii TaxID=108980 RepID=UPI00300A5EE6